MYKTFGIFHKWSRKIPGSACQLSQTQFPVLLICSELEAILCGQKCQSNNDVKLEMVLLIFVIMGPV